MNFRVTAERAFKREREASEAERALAEHRERLDHELEKARRLRALRLGGSK